MLDIDYTHVALACTHFGRDCTHFLSHLCEVRSRLHGILSLPHSLEPSRRREGNLRGGLTAAEIYRFAPRNETLLLPGTRADAYSCPLSR
jgi:hypothetical protein